ncbi:MAG: ParB/RepB/Spo0J family partition protein [Clostridia bacterium]|jgi:ParB family chromosome partitioning protein
METKTGFLEIASIVTSPDHNARQQFDKQGLFDLGKSMQEHTQLAPILVNRIDGRNYLIAGERRLRAAKEAGREMIECKIFEGLDELAALRMSLAENRDRIELNIIEKARSSQKLFEHGVKLAEIAAEEHCSQETIKRRIALLQLNPEVQRLMVRENNQLPIHQALMMVNLNESDQIKLARRIAPITGQVASESQTREWIDEMAGAPLPFKDNGDADEKNQRSDKKKPEAIMADPARVKWWTEQLAAAEKRKNYKINRKGVIVNPHEIRLPTPKASKITILVKIGQTGEDDLWTYGLDITSRIFGTRYPCSTLGTICGLSSDAAGMAVDHAITYFDEQIKNHPPKKPIELEKVVEHLRREAAAIDATREVHKRGNMDAADVSDATKTSEGIELDNIRIEICGNAILDRLYLTVNGKMRVENPITNESVDIKTPSIRFVLNSEERVKIRPLLGKAYAAEREGNLIYLERVDKKERSTK